MYWVVKAHWRPGAYSPHQWNRTFHTLSTASAGSCHRTTVLWRRTGETVRRTGTHCTGTMTLYSKGVQRAGTGGIGRLTRSLGRLSCLSSQINSSLSSLSSTFANHSSLNLSQYSSSVSDSPLSVADHLVCHPKTIQAVVWACVVAAHPGVVAGLPSPLASASTEGFRLQP